MEKSENKRIRTLIVLHAILVFLEAVALAHDIRVFGAGLFQYYTINSNVLQMIVSVLIIRHLFKNRGTALLGGIRVCHLICAVCLTITFFIALLVLAPQEGFAYYFLSDVAPINHFLGPLLSVVTFAFLDRPERLPKYALFAPMAASLTYGFIALILNIAHVLDGPYFFLRVYDEAASTVIMWFAIIAVLCIGLSALYLGIRRARRKS